MLIDCGSALRGDEGNRVVLPFLRSRGVRRIDILCLTHPHEDHYGGAKAILSALPVGEDVKQELLELPDTRSRLRRLATILMDLRRIGAEAGAG